MRGENPMGKSMLKASIKKIEIVNKVFNDNWEQSIRVILGDIELNNENLVELRKFRPNEAVNVCFESQQMSLEDLPFQLAAGEPGHEDITGDEVENLQDEDFCLVEDLEEPKPEEIVQEFIF
jgi:hypothetical protein